MVEEHEGETDALQEEEGNAKRMNCMRTLCNGLLNEGDEDIM